MSLQYLVYLISSRIWMLHFFFICAFYCNLGHFHQFCASCENILRWQKQHKTLTLSFLRNGVFSHVFGAPCSYTFICHYFWFVLIIFDTLWPLAFLVVGVWLQFLVFDILNYFGFFSPCLFQSCLFSYFWII